MTTPTPRQPDEAQVEAVARPMGQWARDIAADYRALAERETWDQRHNALKREARKYEAIADRMDRIPPLTARTP